MSTTTSITSSTATETDTSTGYTTLAEQLRTDQPEDSRDCHRSDCPGSLSLVEHEDWGAEIVICQLCRTTPDGYYIPPTERRSSGSDRREGWGKALESTHPDVDEREEYDNSRRVRLIGGFEPPYDEDDERRPNGVGDDYTFDLTTY